MFEALRRFFSGVCRLTPEILRNIRPQERVKLKLTETSNPHLLSSVYRLLWNRRAMFSLEIWKEGEDDVSFFASADRNDAIEELLRRLMAVYALPCFEHTAISLPEECHVSAGYLKLSGKAYMLRDLEHDPLTHALAAADNVLIQFLFRPEKIVVERFGYESPVFRLRVAVAVFADEWKKAVNACRRVLESFAVLNSAHTALVPVLPRIPNSCILLKSVLERRFLPCDSFSVTAEELATIAHFPGDFLDFRSRERREVGDSNR